MYVTADGAPAPERVEIDGYLVQVADLAAEGRWQELAAHGVYREWLEPGNAVLGHAAPTIGPHPDDGLPAAIRLLAGTAGERLTRVMEILIAALRVEVEEHIDTAILPYTRSMLRDGVLSDVTAEGIREFISDCYQEVNTAMDHIEAATSEAGVAAIAIVWPTYEGGPQQ